MKECPQCGRKYPADQEECPECGITLPSSTPPPGETLPGDTMPGGVPPRGEEALAPGTVLGGRYEILEVIGEGGMGWVYKARDREIDRTIAIKLIRRELARDETMIKRFRQEIVLARNVTHKNVLRIYDIAEAEGFKFITMPYIEGKDLKSLIAEKGRLNVEEAIAIARQVLEALKSAHEAGVIHRDLKPQNILIDSEGNAYVTDFGIAKHAESRGLTATGEIVGTPDYMSPEQAEGKEVDFRSDIYSFGLVLYEMLTGDVAFKADTILTTLMLRLRERPKPPRSTNPEVPAWLDRLVMRTLERDPNDRYQSVEEIIRDIDAQRVKRKVKIGKKAIGLVAAGLIAVAGVFIMFHFKPTLTVEHKRTYLAILPFENVTGDEELDWLSNGIPDNLTADLAQSKFFRVMSPERLKQVLEESGGVEGFDLGEAVSRLSKATDIDAVAVGSFMRAGDKIRITMKVEDARTQEIIGTRIVEGTEDNLLDLIDELTRVTKQIFNLTQEQIAEDLDRELGVQRTRSVKAASLFSKGLELSYAGSYLEAAHAFEAAIEEDPDFAIAYARASEAYRNIGHNEKAEKLSSIAVDRLVKFMDRVPPRDRTFILANHASIIHNTEQAIQSYKDLIADYPEDPEAYYKLALVYESTSDWRLAEENLEKALELDPKFASARYELAKVLIMDNRLDDALKQLEIALDYYRTIGNREGEANVLNAMAVAYRRKNELERAIGYLEASIKIKKELGDKRGIAASLGNLGLIYELTGQLDRALAVLDSALELRKEIGDNVGISHTLNKIGQIYQSYGKFEEALLQFERSYEIRKEMGSRHLMASSLSDMGNIYALMGKYHKALEMDSLALALRREVGDERGEAQSHRNIAEMLINGGFFRQAREHLDRALRIDRALGDERLIARDYQSLAGFHLARGYPDSAIALLDSAISVQERLGQTPSLAVSLTLLAEAYLQKGSYGDACSALESATRTADSVGEVELIVNANLGKARLYQKLGYLAGLDTVFSVIDSHDLTALGYQTGCYLNLERGKAELARGEIKQARQTLEGLRNQVTPEDLRCLLEVNISLSEACIKDGDTAKARSLIDSTLSLAKRKGIGDLLAQANRVLALLQQEIGEKAQALSSCEKAIEILSIRNSVDFRVLILRADFLYAMQRKEKAVTGYKEALEALDKSTVNCPAELRLAALEARAIKEPAYRLVRLLDEFGRSEEASRYRARFSLK